MSTLNLKKIFPGEDVSSLPFMFSFGELATHERNKMEMATRFKGEETISHPDGPLSFDTD